MDRAKYVRIDESKLHDFTERMLPAWDDGNWHYHQDALSFGTLTAQYIFVLDALNFCFWPSTTNIEYDTLAIGLRKALEDDPEVFTPARLQHVTEDDIRGWIRKAGPIGTTTTTSSTSSSSSTDIRYHDLPNLPERVLRLREVGTALVHSFDGSILTFIRSAQSSAVELVRLVTATFPGFRDEAVYDGHHIRFYKRAQILVGDLWAAYGRLTCSSVDALPTLSADQRPFTFYDIDQLTCFADYRIPQLLRAEGILHYVPSLASKIDTLQELYPSSPEEIEIRASTVVVVDRIRSAWNTKVQEQTKNGTVASGIVASRPVTSVEIDWYLWQEGEERKDHLLPHHRVNTIFY